MKYNRLKQTFINGLFFALPLMAIFFLGLKMVHIIEKIIAPAANKIGIQHFLGELTLIVFALIILVLICFLLGILLRSKMLLSINKEVEKVAYNFVPGLYKLKAMAGHDDDNTFSSGWKTVLLQEDDHWILAYITDENQTWMSVFIPSIPNTKDGKLRLIKRSAIQITIEGGKFRSIAHHYGKGLPDAMPQKS